MREREMWSREQKENERASKPGRRMRDGGGGGGWRGMVGRRVVVVEESEARQS